MKNKNLLAIYLLLMAGLFSACSKENILPSSENTLTLDGAPFKVSVASLLGTSIEDEGNASVSFTGTDGTLTKTLGMVIDYSPSQALSGTYAFPATSGARHLDDWLTNYTEMTVSGDVNSTNLEKGTVTVKENGESNFTITVDLVMVDGKKFKGTYKGTVQAVFNNQ